MEASTLVVSVFSCIHVVASTMLVGVGVFFCIHTAVRSCCFNSLNIFCIGVTIISNIIIALSCSLEHQKPALDPPGRNREW